MNPMSIVFALFVALPVALYAREIPDRLSDIREGARGVLAPPVVLAVMIPLGLLASRLTELPVLGWGLLGYNIAMGPVVGSPSGSGAAGAAASSGSGTAYAYLVLVLLVIALAMVVFNYMEEELFRGSWGMVVVWGLLHILVGIEVAYVVPILGGGVVYKVIHDRWGLETAYVAHLSTNLLILVVVGAAPLLA